MYRDLRPYVCTFEACDLKLFKDRHTWFDHELEAHRLQWYCRFCSSPPYIGEADFRSHLRHHAPCSTPEQIALLARACQQSMDRIPATSCPLCDWESSLRIQNASALNDEILVVTPQQFRRHLGRHLEQLALFALPRNYKEDGTGDSNKAVPIAESQSLSHRGSELWNEESIGAKSEDVDIPDILSYDLSKEKSESTQPASPYKTSNYSDTANADTYMDKQLPTVPPEADSNIPEATPMSGFEKYLKSFNPGGSPWSAQRFVFRDSQSIPFPRYGAGVGPVASEEGRSYMMGGLIKGTDIMGDLWEIEVRGTDIECNPVIGIVNGPSPRVGHACLLAGNAFIVWGGDYTEQEGGSLDQFLYLLNTSKSIANLLDSD